ncbi:MULTISPECIES: hypothetical protein [unclassified Sphingopyxis]|nr:MULTISPECIES: hypothetical protein [unclassified Sphingopyxis]
MTHARSETTWIGRLYAALIEASAAAVAVHYNAPWQRVPSGRANRRA